MRSTIAAAVIFAAMGAAAQAEVIGSAPAFGGPTQAVAVCYYSNLGNGPINFSSSRIYAESSQASAPGVVLAPVSQTCGGTLGKARSCQTVANLQANKSVWCRAVVDKKANLRGRLEIKNSSGVVLTSEEAR